MYLSAELRWFWSDPLPGSVAEWFDEGRKYPFGKEPALRRDRYFLQHGNAELGIKIRDEGRQPTREVEIKGLIARVPPFDCELWGKWTSCSVPRGPNVVIIKERQLRLFALEDALREVEHDGGWPETGCTIELTRVTSDPGPGCWWTLGYEAFGRFGDVRRALGETHRFRPPPQGHGGRRMSYPELLAERFGSC